MATLLDITNRVLRRLREDEVADLSDDYAALIADFASDIVSEVNETTIWNAYDTEYTVSVTSGTRDYAITGTTDKSLLLYTPSGMPQAWIFDDASDAEGEPMFYLDPSEYYRRLNVDRDQENDKPQWFTIEKDIDNDDLYIRLWPKPSTTRYIRIRFNTPQAELVPSTDAATEVKLPGRLIFLGALWMAMQERGEEIGDGGPHQMRYRLALGAAVEDEIRARERTGVYDWQRN